MPEQPLHIEDLPGSRDGIRILRLSGPLTLANLFGFQSKVRADNSRALILDFTDVPLADSAGIGALVGAYVTRQKDGRSLGLVGVNQRIHQALEVTRVENFFRFYGTVAEAEAHRGNQRQLRAQQQHRGDSKGCILRQNLHNVNHPLRCLHETVGRDQRRSPARHPDQQTPKDEPGAGGYCSEQIRGLGYDLRQAMNAGGDQPKKKSGLRGPPFSFRILIVA